MQYRYTIYILFSIFFTIMVYHRILSVVFCVTQLDLVVKSSTCLTPHFSRLHPFMRSFLVTSSLLNCTLHLHVVSVPCN